MFLHATGLIDKYNGKKIRRILIYHHINKSSTSSFEKQIAYYVNNFHIVSLGEFVNALDVKENILCITFDDAYKTVYENAAPILDKYGIKPCIFVPVGFVETLDKREYIKNNLDCNIIDDSLTWEELKELTERGYEISSHSWEHMDFSKKNIDYKKELLMTKLALQDKLGCEVRYFAFPFGMESNITQIAVNKAKEYGYHKVFSGVRKNIINDEFLLPRTYINPYWDKDILRCVVSGCFDKN